MKEFSKAPHTYAATKKVSSSLSWKYSSFMLSMSILCDHKRVDATLEW